MTTIIFNVKGTHYKRQLHKRANSPKHYVIHNGRRFTVDYLPYSDVWVWSPWCDIRDYAHRQALNAAFH